jgi:DNA repair protein RadC
MRSVSGSASAVHGTGPARPSAHACRERLWSLGPEALDDGELLDLVLGCGRRGADAAKLSEDLLAAAGDLGALGRLAQAELARLPGLGPARISCLIAAIEIGRRVATRRLRRGDAIRGPADIHRHFFQRLRQQQREHFVVLLLDGRHRVVRECEVSQGTLTASLVHPREVFRTAVREASAAIVLVHNHPSGDPSPSPEDREVTRRLVRAGEILGIRVLDHVVIAEHGFYSFRESGELEAVDLAPGPSGSRA